MQGVKAFKFKLKPNQTFVNECERTLALCRELYNAALQERREAWRICHLGIAYKKQNLQLPEIKTIRDDLKQVHSQVLQDVLQRLDKAFDNFFRRVKTGEKAGYPRFKNADRYNSFTYPQSGFKLEGDKLMLSKIGSCRIRLSRKLEGTIKTCSIRKQADGWYVVFTVTENQSRLVAKTGEDVGIDMGLENFATLSTGEAIANPRFNKRAQETIADAQRILARKKRGSNKRRAAKKLIGKAYLKIKRQRQDFFFKLANRLVAQFDNLAVEQLDIKEMLENGKYAKSISDVSWGTFLKILDFKAAEAGRQVWKTPAAYTSQDCAYCGHRKKKAIWERKHQCEVCGFSAHRDHNSALVVKRQGIPSVTGNLHP